MSAKKPTPRMASVWTDDGDALMSRERVRSQLEHQAAQKGDEL